MLRLHAIVSGRVQGVFFRVSTRDQAQQFILTGWVKNRLDGKVEVICEGPKRNLDRMLEWLHNGPSFAQVTNVDYSYSEKEEGFSDFKISYTY